MVSLTSKSRLPRCRQGKRQLLAQMDQVQPRRPYPHIHALAGVSRGQGAVHDHHAPGLAQAQVVDAQHLVFK